MNIIINMNSKLPRETTVVRSRLIRKSHCAVCPRNSKRTPNLSEESHRDMGKPSPFVTLDINFDEAHDEWMANKRKLANGMYRYVCCGRTKTGKRCIRTPEPDNDMCAIHKVKPIATTKPPTILSQIYGFVKTYPLTRAIFGNTPTVLDPILDVVDETIIIRCNPTIRGSFSQLYHMMNTYDTMERVMDDIQCNGIPRDASHLLLCFQLILSFLDGMDELTKLETKRMNIRRIQMRILQFHGYNTTTHMHTTTTKWKDISYSLKDRIITFMLYVFEMVEDK